MRFAILVLLVAVSAPNQSAQAHCQVPCGIYDDHARVHGMLEDVTTIAKAVDQITTLVDKRDPQSANQLTRWINTKEAHASAIIEVVASYFLTQKIKPVGPKDPAWPRYAETLAAHHAVMRLAMKAKQTVDPKVVSALRDAVAHLSAYWPAPK